MVDEYQDLNPDEQRFVELLTAPNGKLSVIGDDDQSIYEFKGASPNGIREFIAKHPTQNDDIQFSECYRCPTKIVDMANRLIQKNKKRISKTLQAHAENQEGIVDVIHAHTPAEEIDQLCVEIQKEHGSPANLSWDQIVVLTPIKERGKTLYHALQDAGIPAALCFRDAVFDQENAQESFSLLTLAAYPDDLIAWRYLLGKGKNERFSKCYRHVRAYAENQHLGILEVLEKCATKSIHISFTYTLIKRYQEIKEELEQIKKTPQYLLTMLGPKDSDYKELLNNAFARIKYKNNFRELRREVLQAVYSPLSAAPSDHVRIMSLHSAKGLNARLVIIMSAVEDMIPLRNAGTVEEQRRLFYVAITRCKGSLREEFTKDHLEEYPGKLLISAYDNSEDGDHKHSLTRFVGEMGF